MPTFAVDWDGTCVENKYPEFGDWLPGAVEALHILDQHGTVIVHSVRIAPVEPFTEHRGIPLPGKETPRPKSEVWAEVKYIRDMLDSIGLSHVEIWQRPYKPPAFIYIDDRAIGFKGNWRDTMEDVYDKMAEIGGE